MMSLVPKGQPECGKRAERPRVKVEDDGGPTSVGCVVPRNLD